MKNKLRRMMCTVLSLLIFVMALLSTSCNGCRKRDKYYTITYSTSGTMVNSSTIKEGEAIGSLPFTDKQGYSFSGWYFDKELNNRVYAEDIINSDITLYAGFEKQDVNSILPEYSELSISSKDVNYEIKLKSSINIDERNLNTYISITSLYGQLPNFFVTSLSSDNYVITPLGGYENGGVYKITLNDDNVSFIELDVSYDNDYTNDKVIKTIYLSIEADDEEIVSVKSGVYEMKRSIVTFSENENKFTATQSVFDRLPFQVNSIVHIVDTNIQDDSYIKITSLNKVGNMYEYAYTECESVDDVYEDFNINISDIPISNDMTLLENQDATNNKLEAVVNELYTSKGTEELTRMLANALNASPTLYSLTNSSENPYRDNITDVKGKTFTIKGLLDDLEIKVSLGTAKNSNFNGIGISQFDDTRWTMLEIDFNYETEIKNKVKLESTITITQYLYVGLASSANKSTGNFKAEVTPYSQTDISFKVLVCSMSKDDDANKDNDNKKEEKKDISIEIENLANGKGDSSNIIKDVQEMLENKGDAIELCKVPMFSASYTIGGVLSINIDFNFVIKVSFAAGVKIDATLLEATTIGVTGNYKTKKVDCYRRAAKGSDRYIFDFYSYGYLGVKAGIDGELTVSFTGLKQVLRAGVGIEVGAYADLYGYLHYHAEERRVFKDIDTNGRHFQSLDGGMYFESGIYIELSAFVGVGKKEYGVDKEFKFKLLEAGDKYLYVEPCQNDDLTIIFNENENNYVDIEGLIPAEGQFMDITTGNIETKTIPSKNMKLISNTNLFKVDNDKKQLLANMDKIALRLPYGIPTGTISLYYKGPNILFSSAYLDENIAELKGYKELCKVTVVYLPKGMSLESSTDFGKEVNVTYKVQHDNKEEIVKTETIVAGQYYKGEIPSEIITYCHENSLLTIIDNNVVTYDGFTSGKHLIMEDTTFTFKTTMAQRFIAIQYKSKEDFNSKLETWTVDIMALNYNELPELIEKQKYTPDNIYYEYFVITLDGNKIVMGNEYLSKYDLYMTGTYGYETNKVLSSFTGTLEEVEEAFSQMKKDEGVFKEYSKFFTYTLKAEYITGMHAVYFYDINGNVSHDIVKYGETYKVPDYWVNNINQSTSKRIIGWDTNGDDKVDLLPNQQFVVTSDMILKPIMTSKGYTITIIDIDGNNVKYDVEAGSEIPSEIQKIINTKPDTIKSSNENSFYTDSYWTITTSDFVEGNNRSVYFKGFSTMYHHDITIMPSCDMIIKYVKGTLYHYVTIKDETGGYFSVQNDDGTTSNFKEVKIAVKDGSVVGYSKDYQKITYVVPEDPEKAVSYNSILDENNEYLDIYATVINEPRNYHMSRHIVQKDSYSILFEYYIYDEYGKEIYYEKKHEVSNVSKNVFESYCKQYDEEYDYLRSQEFFDKLNSKEYTYSSYHDGLLDHNVTSSADFYGIIRKYYQVVVSKTPKIYKLTIVINDKNYLEQESTADFKYNEIFTCPDESYYKIVDSNGINHDHYFVGYDVDGDGVVDYLPGEYIQITEDIKLSTIWRCSWDTPCEEE